LKGLLLTGSRLKELELVVWTDCACVLAWLLLPKNPEVEDWLATALLVLVPPLLEEP